MNTQQSALQLVQYHGEAFTQFHWDRRNLAAPAIDVGLAYHHQCPRPGEPEGQSPWFYFKVLL